MSFSNMINIQVMSRLVGKWGGRVWSLECVHVNLTWEQPLGNASSKSSPEREKVAPYPWVEIVGSSEPSNRSETPFSR